MTTHPKNKREKKAIMHLADGEPGLLPKGVGHMTMVALRDAKPSLVKQFGYDSISGLTTWQLTSDGLSLAATLAAE